jgi:DNA adenine methylase
MQYFGGKQRIAKQLAEIMNPIAVERGCYVEPFIGGASVMAHIAEPFRIASDANVSLVTMWRRLSEGWEPPDNVSEADYARVSAVRDPGDPLTAFVGFGCSFAGKWFGGYARDGRGRNYASNAASSLKRKLRSLKNVAWTHGCYQTVRYPNGCVIYCDPPYQGTTQYGAVDPFDFSAFWDFCRRMSRRGHVVFVSEYAAPPDFVCIASIETKLDMRTADGRQPPRTEKLFMNADYL